MSLLCVGAICLRQTETEAKNEPAIFTHSTLALASYSQARRV